MQLPAPPLLLAASLATFLMAGCAATRANPPDAGEPLPAPTGHLVSNAPADQRAPDEHYLEAFNHPSGAGADGQIIANALTLAAALGRFESQPASIEALADLVPFTRPIETFSFETAKKHQTEILIVVRDQQSGAPESARFAALELAGECPSMVGFTPPVGLTEGTERYYAGETAEPAHWKDLQWQSHALAGLGSQLAIDDPTLAPQPSESAARLGFLATCVDQAAKEAAFQAASRRSPSSLTELASLYGGLNPLAWTNPYTGEAMLEIGTAAPSPGNYADRSSSDGTLVEFFFLDPQGRIQSRFAGYTLLAEARPLAW